MPMTNRLNVLDVYQGEPENAPTARSPDVGFTQTTLYTATYIAQLPYQCERLIGRGGWVGMVIAAS